MDACRSEEHTSELQSPCNLVCRLLLEKKKKHKRAAVTPPTHLSVGVRRQPVATAPHEHDDDSLRGSRSPYRLPAVLHVRRATSSSVGGPATAHMSTRHTCPRQLAAHGGPL